MKKNGYNTNLQLNVRPYFRDTIMRKTKKSQVLVPGIFVAKTGIEPVTSGLWILRSNHLSYLAIRVVQIYKLFKFPQNYFKPK